MNEFEAAVIGDTVPLEDLQVSTVEVNNGSVLYNGVGLREKLFEASA